MKRAACVCLVAVLLAAVPAGAQEPPAKKSDTVSYITTLPEPGVISARFRDGFMYVSAESGLAIYDVSAPDEPREVGRLPLPNFENEDIDVGNGIALISNDPSEGAGVLHVIDISDPASPERIASFNTGTADNGIITKPLLGPAGFGFGTGHTASCVDDCRWVYLAGTLQGIDIVDLRDPANPKYAGNFPAPEATGGLTTHDVQFDRAGHALISGAGGVAAYDVSDPVAPKLVFHTDETADSRYDETFGADDGSTVNDFIHHNSMRLEKSNIAGATGDPNEDSNVLAITEEDYNRPTCQGAGSFHTWEIGADSVARLLDRWDVEIDPTRQTLCSAHYFDVRGGLVAQGWYEQGTRFLDVSDPRDIRQVGFWIPNKTLTWGALYPPTDPTGEIVYSLDNPRGIDVVRFDRPEPGAPPLQTVTAPPGNAPEPGDGGGPGGGGGTSPTGTAAAIRTNVALSVTDGRSRVRRGRRLSYRVTLKHTAGPQARDLEVLLRFPRGLMRRGRTRVFRRLATLDAGASKTWRVRVRVPRRTKLREVLVQARLNLAEDGNPRDDYAVDRTAVGRRRARDRAARDHLLAKNLALLPTVRAPRSSGRARPIPTRRSAYGWVCRIR
ncbi:MAG TPA: hypothetical protein VF529_00305 [Solirubrobacteraceae bacterium]